MLISIHALFKISPNFCGNKSGNCAQLRTGNMVLVLSHVYYVTLGKTQHLPVSLFKFEMENKNVHPI